MSAPSWLEVAVLLLAALVNPEPFRGLACWTLAGQHGGKIRPPPRWWWAEWAEQEQERQRWRRMAGKEG